MFKIEKMEITGMDMAKSWLERELHSKTDVLSLYKNANEKIRKQFLSMINISVCITADTVWWRNNHRDILISEILKDVNNAEHIFGNEIESNTFRAEYLNYLLRNSKHTKKELWNHMINFIKEGTQYKITLQTDYAKIMEECEDGRVTIPAWHFDLPYFMEFRVPKNKESEKSLASFAYVNHLFVLYMDGKKDCREKVKREFSLSDEALLNVIFGYITAKEIVIYKGLSGDLIPLSELPVYMIDDINEIVELYDMSHNPIPVFNGLIEKEPKERIGILHNNNFMF